MENDFLQGRRVLLICQKFYDYHEKIFSQLESFGAHVVFYENKLFREDPILHPGELISRVKRLLNPNYKKKYIANILSETIDEKFDLLFCVGGFSITTDLIKELKVRNKDIKTVIYFWDSFKVWPFQFLINFFDEVYSFDRRDCERYKIKYLPLFYSENKCNNVEFNKRDIDILYAGSVGPISVNRFKILAIVYDISVQAHLNSFIYLLYSSPKHNIFIKAINFIRKLYDAGYRFFIQSLREYSAKYNFVYPVPLNSKELHALVDRAKCVIDIAVPGQTGLTMRTIESLHMGCKLITTNLSIREEDFFDEDWINVINENDVNIDLNFLKDEPRSSINIDHLSLGNWLKGMVNN